MTNANRNSENHFNMTVSASIASGMSEDSAILNALMDVDFDEDDALSDLDIADEVLEGDELDSFAIEAAIAGELAKTEGNQAVYADEVVGEVNEADTPKELVEAVAPVIEVEPVKKTKKAPKEPTTPRVSYVGHSTSEVLVSRLGEKKAELLILEAADIELPEEALHAKQELFLSSIDALAGKVGEKAVMLFGYIRNGGKLNAVMQTAFEVLAKDGHINSGPKGNLQMSLLKRLSPGTSASQANQIQSLFPALAITIRDKGHMVPNPNSLILMKIKAELGLA